jgi:hypothetical protein
MNTTLTREAILQLGIHHWTAALEYSGSGLVGAGGVV